MWRGFFDEWRGESQVEHGDGRQVSDKAEVRVKCLGRT